MEVVHAQERRKPADFHARSRAVAISRGETHIEEAMMSNARAAATAATTPLEFKVMSGSSALHANQPAT